MYILAFVMRMNIMQIVSCVHLLGSIFSYLFTKHWIHVYHYVILSDLRIEKYFSVYIFQSVKHERIELGFSITNIFSKFNNLRYVCRNIHNVFKNYYYANALPVHIYPRQNDVIRRDTFTIVRTIISACHKIQYING